MIIKGLFVHATSHKSCKGEATKHFENPYFFMNSLDHGDRHFISILKIALKGLDEFALKGG